MLNILLVNTACTCEMTIVIVDKWILVRTWIQIFNNNNAANPHIGCVDELNAGHFIMVQGFKPETVAETNNKNTKNIAKSYS